MTNPTVTATPSTGAVPRLSRVIGALLGLPGSWGWAMAGIVSLPVAMIFVAITLSMSGSDAPPREVAVGLGVLAGWSAFVLGLVVESVGVSLRSGRWQIGLPRAAAGWFLVEGMIAGVHAVVWGIGAWAMGVGMNVAAAVSGGAFGIFSLGWGLRRAFERAPAGAAGIAGGLLGFSWSVVGGSVAWTSGGLATLGVVIWIAEAARLARSGKLPAPRQPSRRGQPSFFDELGIEDWWVAQWLPGPRVGAIASARRALARIPLAKMLALMVFFTGVLMLGRGLIESFVSRVPAWQSAGLLAMLGLSGVKFVRDGSRAAPAQGRMGGGARWLGERGAALVLSAVLAGVVLGSQQLLGGLVLGLGPLPLEELAVGLGLLFLCQASFELGYEVLGPCPTQRGPWVGSDAWFLALIAVPMIGTMSAMTALIFGAITVASLLAAMVPGTLTLYALAYALHARRLRAGDFV